MPTPMCRWMCCCSTTPAAVLQQRSCLTATAIPYRSNPTVHQCSLCRQALPTCVCIPCPTTAHDKVSLGLMVTTVALRPGPAPVYDAGPGPPLVCPRLSLFTARCRVLCLMGPSGPGAAVMVGLRPTRLTSRVLCLSMGDDQLMTACIREGSCCAMRALRVTGAGVAHSMSAGTGYHWSAKQLLGVQCCAPRTWPT
jgi:hypothetical protein